MKFRRRARERTFQYDMPGIPEAEKKRKDDWTTPGVLWTPMMEIWDFQLDAAADSASALVPRFFGPGSSLGEDALRVSWPSGSVSLEVGTGPEAIYCNPPFSKKLAFLIKAQVEAEKGCYVVVMLPASTSEGWWKDLVVGCADYVIFFTGRIPFDDKPDNMGGNSLVVFEPKMKAGVATLKQHLVRLPLTFWWDWREVRDLSKIRRHNLYDLARESRI